MELIKKRQENRVKFINKLYELTEGDPWNSISSISIGSDLCLLESETERIVKYFEGEGFLIQDIAGNISLTNSGINEVEKALIQPNSESRQTMTIYNHLNIGTATNTSIQQGNQDSNQTVLSESIKLEDIRAFLDQIESQKRLLNLEQEFENKLNHEIEKLRKECMLSKPGNKIISESLGSIRNVLEGVAGNVIASVLISSMASLM